MLDREVLRHQLVSRRTFLLASAEIGLLSLLLSRMFYLQIIKGSDYKILSEKNRISLVLIPPTRGIIYDKNGQVIAENRSSFFIKIDRRKTKQYKDSIETLFEVLYLNEDQKRDIYSKLKKSSHRMPVTLFSDIGWSELSLIEENLVSMEGIYAEQIDLRKYNYPFSCSHITGYVGKISESEINNYDQVTTEFLVGKTGLEKQYEKILQGEFGYKRIEIDAKGLFVDQIDKVNSVEGQALELNIDVNLQEIIFSLLPREGGSAVVMDVSDGAIIACVSSPSFDANSFVGGISNKLWEGLTKDSYKPLINKIIQAQYPPGSTFKLITVLAALEAGMSPAQKFLCTGNIQLGNKIFHCWNLNGHGTLDMVGAIKHSCNCYMYNIGRSIGVDKIVETAKRFGLGKITGIDLPAEAKGFVPDRQWKLRNFKFDWSLGDSFNIAIGQGALLCTPIQQAVLTAAFVTEGKLMKPRLAKSSMKESSEFFINPEHLKIIKEGMYKAVNEEGGTNFRNKSDLAKYSGKTGTSQVQAKKHAKDDLSSMSIKWERRNHGLFAGFFPCDNPRYVMSIIIDHGGSGGKSAGPIAKAIAEYLNIRSI